MVDSIEKLEGVRTQFNLKPIIQYFLSYVIDQNKRFNEDDYYSVASSTLEK